MPVQQFEIPILYIFHFDDPYFDKAIERLKYSLLSIGNQVNKIFILNASKKRLICKDDRITLINKPDNKYFNKSKLINYMIKTYLKDYFYYFASDIDLVWHLDFMNRCREEINKNNEPIRIVPYNYVMNYEFYEHDFLKLMPHIQKDFKNLKPNNWSHGNGLIHIPSFIKIQGYNEEFCGYSAKDQEFNSRIGKINKLIYSYEVADIHLWHEPMNREYEKENEIIWKDSLEQIEKNNIIRNKKGWINENN